MLWGNYVDPLCGSIRVCTGFVTMCVKNVLTVGIFTIKLPATFVAPLFSALDQNKPDLFCEVSNENPLAEVCC